MVYNVGGMNDWRWSMFTLGAKITLITTVLVLALIAVALSTNMPPAGVHQIPPPAHMEHVWPR